MLFIFDCDGTLVDSEYLNNAALSQVLMEEGLQEYTPERCLELFTGFSLEECLNLVRKRESGVFFVDSEIIRRYTAITLDNMNRDLRVDPMTVPTLDIFRQRGFHMVVASNGEHSIVKASIKAAGMTEFFSADRIYTKSMVAHPKPAPDLFKLALHKTGTDSRFAIVVEDSVTGVMAAKAAGLRCIGITSFASNKERRAMTLRNAGADHIIENFSELLDFAGIAEDTAEDSSKELQTGFSGK